MLPHDWFPQPLPENVEIGERSWLYSSYSMLHSRSRRPAAVRIGPDSGVYNGTHFELGPEGEVEIGRFCTVVGAIIRTNARVRIGDYSFVAHEVVIADSAFATPPTGAPEPTGGRGIEIGANAWIGTRAVLLDGARIGDDAIVGAGSVVTGSVPAGATAVGVPARVVDRRG